MPYRDDWDWFRWLLGATSVSSYFVPHNEHVIPLARLLLQGQYRLEGSNGYTMLAVSLASLAGVVLLTLREIGRRWPADAVTRRWVSGVSLAFLCFAWQLQSMVFPAAVLFPLVELFALASVTCLLNAGELAGGRRGRWLGLSALCAVAAMLTTTNGLPVPIVLALVAGGRRMGWRVVAGFMALAVAAVGLYVAFVLSGPHAAGGRLSDMPSTWVIAAFFLAFHASLVAQVTASGGVVLGAVLFLLGLYVVATALWHRDRPRVEYFAVGILLFTMASAALGAPARGSLGIVQVAQSRYASFVQPYWMALFLVAVSRSAPERLRRFAAPALIASVSALGAQAVIGAVWVAKADNVATAGLALRSGGGDDEWLMTLYPSAATPREVAAALVADGDRTLGGPLPQLPPDLVAGLTACVATARVTPVPAGSGLRLHASVLGTHTEGVILDRAGHTVGLARRAPVADTPNPSPMDVARAVGRTLRAPTPEQPPWIGFAAVGAGAPYTLLVLDMGAAPVCGVHATGP